jgi:outer membrane protein assembly factor BamA
VKILLGLNIGVLLLYPAYIRASSGAEQVVSSGESGAQHARLVDQDSGGSWLPVPIPMSNPTLGAGLQLSLLYLHGHEEGDQDTPNATSGIGGLYTDNKSKAVGVFHNSAILDDQFRLKAMFGRAEFNLDFYGIGEVQQESSAQYTMKANTGFVQLLSRLSSSQPWFAGVRYFWIDAELSSMDLQNRFPNLPLLSLNPVTAGLGIVLNFDDRNDSYYPSSGQKFELNWSMDDEKWGSNFEFNKLTSSYSYFYPVDIKNVLALRASLSNVEGNAPFYLLSDLDMRGFPRGKYLDDTSASVNLEWRNKFRGRWGAVAFIEYGEIGSSFETLSDGQSVTSYGVGLRWQAIKSKQLNLGVDFAFSDDEDAIYLRIGESF